MIDTILYLHPPAFSFVIVIVAVVIWIVSSNSKRNFLRRNQKYFGQIAQTLKLQHQKAGYDDVKTDMPFLEGVCEGFEIGIYGIQKGYDRYGHNQSQYFTLLNVTVEHATGFTFQVGQTTLMRKIGKTLGAQDIKTGNTDFDEKFILKGNDEHWVLSVFNHEVCNEIAESEYAFFGDIILKDNVIIYQKHDLIESQPSCDKLKRMLEICILIAKQIDKKKSTTVKR